MRKTDKALLFTLLLMIAVLIAGIICHGQDWKPNPKYIKPQRSATSDTVKKYQCYGTTTTGNRCKRTVTTDKGYCYQHARQAQ